MTNRTVERWGIRRSRIAVIHPSPFVVKSMHMQYLKTKPSSFRKKSWTKSPYGSNRALLPNLCYKWGGVIIHTSQFIPALTVVVAGILASE